MVTAWKGKEVSNCKHEYEGPSVYQGDNFHRRDKNLSVVNDCLEFGFRCGFGFKGENSDTNFSENAYFRCFFCEVGQVKILHAGIKMRLQQE